MKKRIILFVILFCVYTLSYSQVNEYFLNNPVWLVESVSVVPGNCLDDRSTNYYIDGDTIISSTLYKKIGKKVVGNIRPCCPTVIGCSGYYGSTYSPSFFLRSDGKKMFVREEFGTSEYLLYDFDLAVGDTLPLSYNNSGTITVTAIDSIYTPYGYRKRFALTGIMSGPNYLLEGIGNSRGLIEPFLNVPGTLHDLDCYSLNNASYYPVTGQTCEFFVGINSPEEQTDFLIYPNPFSKSTTLQFNSYMDNWGISIYDISGRLVKKTEGISGTNILIDREKLKAGLYFFEIRQNNETTLTTGKFLIVD